jgi:hypothetical protein
MNLKLLRTFFAVALVTAAGQSWSAPSVPADGNPAWQDIPDNTSVNGGIQWSINGGAWSNVGSTNLYVGQTVQFKLTMHKYEDGNHYADLIKAWVDWDNSNSYNNTVGSSEILLAGAHVVNNSLNWHADNVVNQSFDFLSGAMTVNAGMLGDHYLLARVVCSDTLLSVSEADNGGANLTPHAYGNFNQQWDYSITDMEKWFSPTANYAGTDPKNLGQGDSDQVKFTVKANQVPEPGTLALFAAAMLGMGLRRKQATRV